MVLGSLRITSKSTLGITPRTYWGKLGKYELLQAQEGRGELFSLRWSPMKRERSTAVIEAEWIDTSTSSV